MINNFAIYVGAPKLHPNETFHEYAEECELVSIMSEITRIVARKNNLNSAQAINEYLNQCSKGEHVVLKSYSSFSKSTLNRQCFLYNFCKIFEIQNNNRNGLDYFQLFRLLCSDFPKQVITNSVRLLQGPDPNNMSVLLNSKLFINSLYINFIFYEYLDNMLHKLFNGNVEQEIPLTEIYQWVKEEDKKNFKKMQKPQISQLFQILLNTLNKKGLIKIKGLTFLNEKNMDQFIQQSTSQENPLMSYLILCNDLLKSKSHQKFVENNLMCFDNSTSWGNEVGKLLSHKEIQTQPLNTKKVKKK